MTAVLHGPIGVAGAPLMATDAPSPDDFRALFRALDTFNAPYVGHVQSHHFGVFLRDASGTVTGGLWGRTVYSWLVIDMLFVPQDLRGRGIGSALVRMAETTARERACIAAQVETFDFQARAFYERNGFTVFGVQQDFPPGHTRFHLSHRLDGGGRTDAVPH